VRAMSRHYTRRLPAFLPRGRARTTGSSLFDIFKNWRALDSPMRQLAIVALEMAIYVGAGLSPGFDNWMHIGLSHPVGSGWGAKLVVESPKIRSIWPRA